MGQVRRGSLGVASLLGAAALWGACGGASSVLTGGDGGSGGSSGSAGSGSGTSASSSGSGSGGTSSGSGSGGGSSGSGGSSSGGASGSSGGSGSGSSSGTSSSGSGSSSSSGSGGSAVRCPYNPCASGEVCCAVPAQSTVACTTSCSSEDTFQCLGPGDCAAGTDCCESVVLSGGMPPNCQTQSASAQCVAGCTTSLGYYCNSHDTLHICAQGSDCAGDTANPNCCNLQGQWVCVNGYVKMSGLQCK